MRTKAVASGRAPESLNRDSGKGKEWFQIMRADTIEPKHLDWLWWRYLPRGMITMLTGDPSAGKSTLILDIVARLSRGDLLPEEPSDHSRSPVKCWVMSSEDAADTIISWRLINQGARMENVFVTDQRKPMSGPGLRAFEQTIVREQIGFVVVDTVTTWMGDEIDMNKANEVMGWLNPLKEIAQRTGCTIVLIRHRRKGAANDNKLYSGMGSIGFTAAVRSELSAYVTKSGMRMLERTKGNIGAPPPSLGYVITDSPYSRNLHGVLSWLGPMEDDTGGGAVTVSKKPKKIAQAQEWLRQLLSQGPVPASEVYAKAKEAKISEPTLKRAKVGVVETVNSGTGWVWQLSSEAATTLGPDGEEYMECQ